MEMLFFLTENQYFKQKVTFLNYDYYYFESEPHFHARIFIPKSEKFDFSWYYYGENNKLCSSLDDIPDSFRKLVIKSMDFVNKRDRIRRLFEK